jgi:FdhD protein
MSCQDVMVREVEVARWRGPDRVSQSDSVVVEEPLEIRVNDSPLAVTMRTPGHDDALALGFLVSEGLINSVNEVFDILRCADPDYPDLRNIITVVVDPALVPETLDNGRQRYATSSCGLCGRATIESVRQCAAPLPQPPQLRRDVLLALPDRLRAGQAAFQRTGGLHAAGLFDLDGRLLHLAEDVGRHNAVDKVVGLALMQGPWPPAETILMVSGRAGFEIVQKAVMARIPALCSVSAPSSLAVELAREMNLMLAGFLRGDSMNVYSGGEKVV